jgi:peptidoglycan-associated lipoprotein
MRQVAAFFVTVALAASASAQLPGLRRRAPVPPPAPVLVGIDALRADFLAHTGADTIFFGSDSVVLGPPAKATLTAQAQWLLQHPEVAVRIEGHADSNDTRDHALAVGARRAEEVRQYLILMGVPAAQLSAVSMGKERPGLPRAQTILVR